MPLWPKPLKLGNSDRATESHAHPGAAWARCGHRAGVLCALNPNTAIRSISCAFHSIPVFMFLFFLVLFAESIASAEVPRVVASLLFLLDSITAR